jgi:hypothetical protein
MIMATKKHIFKEHLPAYLRADKQAKGEILKHVCFVTGMHIKAAIRKFRKLQMRNPFKDEQRGRAEYYTPDVTIALKEVWEAGNEVCGELLHPMIAEYVDIFKRDKMWTHPGDATAKLLEMSEATVRRRVSNFKKARHIKKGTCTTKPSHIKHLVPVFIGPWHDKPPGYGQIDTVRHSNSAYGDAAHTLNYTDAATLTPVLRAQWNKGQLATRESMKRIKTNMPFDWLGAHPDTGSEFLNYLVMAWCQENDIELSRSRPNHKNDNMYVEERNGHVIRKTIGYITLNCPEAVDALNAVYDILNIYLLHFVAVRRMLNKEKLASRYKRTYERTPKTPYQRILEHEMISESLKQRLRLEHSKLNPLILKQEIDRRLKLLYDTQRRYGNRR